MPIKGLSGNKRMPRIGKIHTGIKRVSREASKGGGECHSNSLAQLKPESPKMPSWTAIFTGRLPLRSEARPKAWNDSGSRFRRGR